MAWCAGAGSTCNASSPLRQAQGRLERFGIRYHERTIGKLLKGFGFAKLSPRPVHPEQDPRTIEAFRQTGPRR